MECGVGKSSFIVVFFSLGCAIAGFFPSILLPKIGLKNSVYIAGIGSALAYSLVALLLPYKSVWLTAIILMVFAGFPSGLASTAVFTSARERGDPSWMGFIMTIEFAGLSTAAFIQPVLFNWLINQFGLRNAFYGIAIFQLSNLLAGLLILDEIEPPSYVKQEAATRVVEKPKFISFKLIKDQCYALFAIFQGGYGIGWSMMIPYLESFLIFLHFEGEKAAYMVAYIGIIEAAARIFYAVITDRVNKLTLLIVTVAGNAVALSLGLLIYFWPAVFGSYKTAIMFISFTGTGFFDAGYGGLANAVLVDITDDSNYKVAQGMNQFLMAFYCVLGPLIGGLLVDLVTPVGARKSYWVTFLVGSSLMVVGALTALRLKILSERRQRKLTDSESGTVNAGFSVKKGEE